MSISSEDALETWPDEGKTLQYGSGRSRGTPTTELVHAQTEIKSELIDSKMERGHLTALSNLEVKLKSRIGDKQLHIDT